MTSLKFKDVVSFSSQDPVHKVFNLLEQNSQFKRWLCAPDDKTGKLQAEFQLEKASTIDFVDIGNFGSAFVEVQVRRSSWPEGKSVPMIPATIMMLPQHCRVGKNKCSVKMFTRDQLTPESAGESWDRVKVICTQPYKRDTQYGLAFIRLASSAPQSDAGSPEASGPTMKKLASSTPSQPEAKKKLNILSPSWKTNASFHRQVIAATRNEQYGDVGLKNRLLKISATGTSESETGKDTPLGRAAKLVMAAASSRKKSDAGSATTNGTMSSPPSIKKKLDAVTKRTTLSPDRHAASTLTNSNYACTTDFIDECIEKKKRQKDPNNGPSGGSTCTKDYIDECIKAKKKESFKDKPFSEIVEDFLKTATDDKLKHSTLKALRKDMEQQYLGRKLNSPEKAEFKAKAILAVGRLLSDAKADKTASKSTPSPKLNIPKASKVAGMPSTNSTPHGTQKSNSNFSTPNRQQNSYSSISTPSRPQNSNSKNFQGKPALKLNPLSSAYISPKPNSPSSHIIAFQKSICKTVIYGGKRYNSPSSNQSTPNTSNNDSQRNLPKSQRKRPHSPEIELCSKAARKSSSPDNDAELMKPSWLSGSKTSTPTSGKAPAASTPSQRRDVPPWMADACEQFDVGFKSSPSSSTGASSRGRGRGGIGAGSSQSSRGTGERKPCYKCNKTFTAKGITRHMLKCTGQKQPRTSRGRGRGKGMGRNSFEYVGGGRVDENAPGPSSSRAEPTIVLDDSLEDSFGLMNTDMVPCPMCREDFPVTLIELHAAMCGDSQNMMDDSPSSSSLVCSF